MRKYFYLKRFGFELFIGSMPGNAWTWDREGVQCGRLVIQWASPWGARAA